MQVKKYCWMLQREHSAILSTFIKLPVVTKTFVLSIFEWPFYTGFTVSPNLFYILRPVIKGLYLTGLQIRVRTGILFLLYVNQNICCGYSKEPSQWEGSFEHTKHMFKLMCKEINAILGAQTILIWTYVTSSVLPLSDTFKAAVIICLGQTDATAASNMESASWRNFLYSVWVWLAISLIWRRERLWHHCNLKT